MQSSIKIKLSIMMFFEFFIWGAWLPLLGTYLDGLKFNGTESAWIFNAFALASVTAMFFSTQFADRNFAAERFLAFSHLIGGLAMLGLAYVHDFWPFFGLMLLHSLFYVPTISITNSIAFANLQDSQKDFGPIRLWGTIGWIAASWPFIFILVDWARITPLGEAGLVEWIGQVLGTPKTGMELQEGTRFIFVAAGGASLLLAAFSLALPHTPPKPAMQAGSTFAWLEAMRYLKVPALAILFLVTFIDSTVHAGFFMLTGGFLQSPEVGVASNWVMPVMSIGQFAEIGTMAVLGLFLKRFGWKTTLIIGILGHTVRFGVFALAPHLWLVVGVQVLHGICYAFFFATLYIFVDEYFPKDARSSAQGLFNFLILGVGQFVGNFLWSGLKANLTTGADKLAIVDYHTLFLYPAGLALLGALVLLIFFYPPSKESWVDPRMGQDQWRSKNQDFNEDEMFKTGLPVGDPRREGIQEG